MAMNRADDDLAADLEVLEAIGERVDLMVQSLLDRGAVQRILRRWLAGHAEAPDDAQEQRCLMAMAADLEMFAPSMSGRTMVDRHLAAWTPQTPTERAAHQALGAAQFHLVRVVGREGPDLVRLRDLVGDGDLLVLDDRISPLAEGVATAMRLCPLASGRRALISPLFALDESLLAAAMTFVRPGRPLGQGHRCAAALYRDVARGGFWPMPQSDFAADPDALDKALKALEDALTPIQLLALRWVSETEDEAGLAAEARRMASVDVLVDALGHYGQMEDDGPPELRAAYERIADLQLETLAQRARDGAEDGDVLDRVGAEVSALIGRGGMEVAARELFERLRRRWGA